MIDWIVAERIATVVAGTGEAPPPKSDLAALAAESEARVTAYTGLHPTRPLPEPEGISRRERVASNIKSRQALLDPVLERAGNGLEPLRPALPIGTALATASRSGRVRG